MSAADLSTLAMKDTKSGGMEIDVRAIRGEGPGEVSAEIVAADVATYATTAAQGGLSDRGPRAGGPSARGLH